MKMAPFCGFYEWLDGWWLFGSPFASGCWIEVLIWIDKCFLVNHKEVVQLLNYCSCFCASVTRSIRLGTNPLMRTDFHCHVIKTNKWKLLPYHCCHVAVITEAGILWLLWAVSCMFIHLCIEQSSALIM